MDWSQPPPPLCHNCIRSPHQAISPERQCSKCGCTYSVTKTDLLIVRINSEELWRLRRVWGLDLGDWHPYLDALIAAGKTQKALDLLAELIIASETLVQYDSREPEPYWYERAAVLYRRLHRLDDEAAILERWLTFWPETRYLPNKSRERIIWRLGRVRQLLAKRVGPSQT